MLGDRFSTIAVPSERIVWDEYTVPPIKLVDDNWAIYTVLSGFAGISALLQFTVALEMYIVPQDTTLGTLHKVEVDIIVDSASSSFQFLATTLA